MTPPQPPSSTASATNTSSTCFDLVPLRALADNYIWLLRRGRHAAVIDPGAAQPVIDYLQQESLELLAILITHHHQDHTAGLIELRTSYPQARSHGPAHDDIPLLDVRLEDGDRVDLPELASCFSALHVPGHTLGHLAYHDPDLRGTGVLLAGDTLFSAGCGRVFEGTTAQMQASLARLRALPASTRLFCAHEYTAANLRFAATVEPDNPDIQAHMAKVAELRAAGLPTLPSSLALECRINPMLRWDAASVMAAASRWQEAPCTTDVEVFSAIRRWKDTFQ